MELTCRVPVKFVSKERCVNKDDTNLFDPLTSQISEAGGLHVGEEAVKVFRAHYTVRIVMNFTPNVNFDLRGQSNSESMFLQQFSNRG